jgi:hypothetical protein
MAKCIDLPLEETVKLIEFDPDGDEFVTIRQARAREARLRQDHFAKVSYEQSEAGGNVRQVLDWSDAELVVKECWLTTTDCSLKMKNDKGEEVLLFKLPMQYASFKDSFDKLPIALVREWHRAVLKVNPNWRLNGGEAEEAKN